MSITKTIISNSPNRTVIKVTATAAADTTTISLKTAAVPITVSATFDAAAKTITRAAGSWLDEFPGAALGSVVVITVSGGSALNLGTFSGVITSTTIITLNSFYTLVDEGPVSVTNLQWSGYWSDVGTPGQIITTPKANITKMWYSVSSAGDVLVSRNSVAVAKLFGHDTIQDFGMAENNSYDVVVLFEVSLGGTLIIEISKVDGYSYPPSWTVNGAR